MVAWAGINEVMRSKDAVRGESTRHEKRERVWTMGEERIEVIEDTELDTGIVSDLREGDGEIEIIIESTKIGEGRVDEAGSGEEMKGREAGRTGEDCGRNTTGSSAWPWLGSGMLTTSSPLACVFNKLFLSLVFCLSLLIERLILRRSDRCCCHRT